MSFFFFHAFGRVGLYTASQLAATGRNWQGFRELVVTTTERTKKKESATLQIQHPSRQGTSCRLGVDMDVQCC